VPCRSWAEGITIDGARNSGFLESFCHSIGTSRTRIVGGAQR
jgi:hypothetical protein